MPGLLSHLPTVESDLSESDELSLLISSEPSEGSPRPHCPLPSLEAELPPPTELTSEITLAVRDVLYERALAPHVFESLELTSVDDPASGGKTFYQISSPKRNEKLNYIFQSILGMMDYVAGSSSQLQAFELIVNLVTFTRFPFDFNNPEFFKALETYDLIRYATDWSYLFISTNAQEYKDYYSNLRTQFNAAYEAYKKLDAYRSEAGKKSLDDSYGNLCKAVDRAEALALHYLQVLQLHLEEKQDIENAARIDREAREKSSKAEAGTPPARTIMVSPPSAVAARVNATAGAGAGAGAGASRAVGLFSKPSKEDLIHSFAESISYDRESHTIKLNGVAEGQLKKNSDCINLLTAFTLADQTEEMVNGEKKVGVKLFQQLIDTMREMLEISKPTVTFEFDVTRLANICPLQISHESGNLNYSIHLYRYQEVKGSAGKKFAASPYTEYYSLLREQIYECYSFCLRHCRDHSPEPLSLLRARYERAIEKINQCEKAAAAYVSLFKRLAGGTKMALACETEIHVPARAGAGI